MTGTELVRALDALLTDHPAVAVSPKGLVAHANYYVAKNGCRMATEPERAKAANIWVHADPVRRRDLGDIDHHYFHRTGFDASKPNHNLFGESAFKDSDLIRYQPSNLWQGVKVIVEVANSGRLT